MVLNVYAHHCSRVNFVRINSQAVLPVTVKMVELVVNHRKDQSVAANPDGPENSVRELLT